MKTGNISDWIVTICFIGHALMLHYTLQHLLDISRRQVEASEQRLQIARNQNEIYIRMLELEKGAD